MTWLRAAREPEQGQSLVEFALVSIVFFILAFGMVDAGRAVWNYNTLAQATREGTRYAIVHGANSADPSGPGTVYYTPPNTDTNVTQQVEKFGSGLNVSRLTVQTEWPDGSNTSGSHVKVTSQYQYEPMFNFLGLVSITMTSSSTMEITN
ncbi:MAG: pilus assembly protein [Chloroflexi bacterium]|nr:pilus assembly protein [Chloroflexota bacterium]